MKMRAIAARALLFLTLAAGPGVAQGTSASPCHDMVFEGQRYTVCEARAGSDLRLFLDGADGAPLGAFSAVNAELAAEGKTLAFAMNAGMYHPDRRPVGLYVERGVEVTALQTRAGPGNFGMRPNGVFCVTAKGFAVIESRAFARAGPACRYATQSGPMLVIDGALHPRFVAESTSTNIRNGVGVSADGQVARFVISDRPVNFHTFARLFRDGLGTPDALFLDGSISRLYAPALGRDDFGFRMGPMVGLVVPRD